MKECRECLLLDIQRIERHVPKNRKKIATNKGYFGAPKKISNNNAPVRGYPRQEEAKKTVSPPWYVNAAPPEERKSLLERKFARWAGNLVQITRQINVPLFDPKILNNNDTEGIFMRWEHRERAIEVSVTNAGVFGQLFYYFPETREEYGATCVVDKENQETWFSQGNVEDIPKTELL